MTCVDFDCLFMLKKVMCFYNKKSFSSSFFERLLKHTQRIELHQWRKSQTFWQRWENHWAHFLLTRIDPFVALRQFRMMKG